MTAPNFRLLRQYMDTDAKLIPLCEWRATKTGKNNAVLKLGKTPNTKGWQDKTWSQEDMLAHMENGGNVGFRCGDGWGIIDFDPRNDLDADGKPRERKNWTIWRVLADFNIRQGEYAVVETGGGGYHIYLRGVPAGYHGRERIDTYGPSVEFKTSPRRFVVCAGSLHPGANNDPLPDEPNPYLWGATSVPLAKTCDAPEALLEAFAIDAPAAHLKGSGEETFGRFSGKELERVLEHIPVKDFGKNSPTKDHDWLNWMFACHWMTGGAGREEWIEWCLGDDDYYDGHEQLRQRWDSCSANARGVKSGLIFKMLGYYEAPEEAYPREKTSEAVMAPDVDELDISQEPESKEAGVLRYMNKQYAVVRYGSKTMIMFDDFDDARETIFPNFMDPKQLGTAYMNKFILVKKMMANGKPKFVDTNYYDFWMRHAERREYKGVTFMPNEAQDILRPNGLHFNTWTGWPFEVEDGRGHGNWDALEEVIRTNLCAGDEASFEYLMNWMAYSLQYPVGPQRVAVVLRGKKGTGKSTLGEAWLKMFGRHGMETARSDAVFGRFNSHLREVLGLFLDEAFWGGDKTVLGSVKTLITQEAISTEQKFVDGKKTKNHLKIMMATNEEWAVPATDDERRFVVFDVEPKYISRDPILGEMHEQLYGTDTQPHTYGLRAFYYDLATRDVSRFNPERERVITKALLDQVRIGLGDAGEWWYEVLSDGVLPGMFEPDFRDRQTGPLADWENRRVAVPLRLLRDSLDHYLNAEGRRPSGDLAYNFRSRWFSKFVDLIPANHERGRMTLPGDDDFLDVATNRANTAEVVVLPPLPECREKFSRMVGRDFELLDPKGEEPPALGIDDLV